jgi:hypothetical protein
MAIPSPAAILSHWHTLLENFQTAPLDFYSLVEDAVKRREIPNIEVSRVDWSESGVFSAKREYLRVARGPYVFDICGAPFGTGFFVSSWLVRPQVTPWPFTLFLLALSAGLVFIILTSMFSLLGPILFPFVYPALFWGFVQMMNQQKEGWDESIVAIPFLGAIYERIFRPETYYRVDTRLMFEQSVHNAVLEAIDSMTTARGLRALSEVDRALPRAAFAKGAGS